MTQVEKKAWPYHPIYTFTGPRWTLGASLWHLVNVGFIPWPRWATTIPPHKPPPIHSYYAPFFSPLPNSHFSPTGIPLLTQSTFSSISQPVDQQHTHHYLSLIHI